MSMIRWMIRADIPQTLKILSTTPIPWAEEKLLQSLRQRNVIGMVYDVGPTIAGAMVYALHKSKIELLTLAVHPEFRNRGIGQDLIARLVSKLSPHNRTEIEISVHEICFGMQRFLRRMGFFGWPQGEEIVFSFEIPTAEECRLAV